MLQRLLAAHPDLLPEAEQLARSLVADVDFEAIACEVEDSLRAVDLDDLNDRAGTHHGEYTEPADAAWEILQEAIDTLLADMRRQSALGLDRAALETCKGIVLGLYRVRSCRDHAVLGWAPDFPKEAAVETLGAFVEDTCRTGRAAAGAAHFDDAFLEAHVPDWRQLVDAAQSPVGGTRTRPAAETRHPASSRSARRGNSPARGPRPRR